MTNSVARRCAASALLGFLALACASRASAQQIVGSVHDSATNQPIPGAVLILLTGSGATVARTITNGDGRFTFGDRGQAASIRALHIGFRPRGAELPPATTTVTSIDVTLASLGSMLDTIHVVASNKCSSKGSAAQAQALLEQAREGVLATDVAAESKPADMVRLRYVRTFDSRDKIASQSVHRVANRTVDSFRAVYTGEQFVQMGFQQDSAGYLVFFAPDARTIVDPGFATGYCFHLTGDKHRPLQVGLAFSPAARRKDRVDIEGTLWADTARRELRDIEFQYVGLDDIMNRVAPGGRIAFRPLVNGVVLVDDWSLRLPVVRRDTVRIGVGRRILLRFGPQESGGRVVSAKWPDYTWSAPMGTLEATLRDSSGALLAGAFARLDDTDYGGRADSTGTLRIAGLLPGPYTLSVLDSAYADFHVKVGPSAHFAAAADTVTHLPVVVAAPLAGVVAAYCPKGLDPGESSVVIGRLFGDSGSVVSGGVVTAAWGPVADDRHKQAELPDSLRVQSTTNDDGVYTFCGLPSATPVVISATSGTDRTATKQVPMPRTRQLVLLNLYLIEP